VKGLLAATLISKTVRKPFFVREPIRLAAKKSFFVSELIRKAAKKSFFVSELIRKAAKKVSFVPKLTCYMVKLTAEIAKLITELTYQSSRKLFSPSNVRHLRPEGPPLNSHGRKVVDQIR